jgi:hypothetical protein
LKKKSTEQTNLIKLYSKLNNKLLKLSGWCDFFIQTGKMISDEVDENSRFIFALALPTRSFSSGLISLGYIIKRIHLNHDVNNYSYTEYLITLPINTPIILRSADEKKYKGLLLGSCWRNGTGYFELALGKYSFRYIKFEEANRIEVTDSKVNLPNIQKGRPINPESDFCMDLIGQEFVSDLTLESNFELAIIGPKNLIKEEVTIQEFFTVKGYGGNLQEILRIKEFQSISNAYRSRIISDRIKAVKIHTNIKDPPLVIFDGAQGFLKWRTYWKQSNWVILLDRTENQFQVAVEQINREYALYRTENFDIDPLRLNIPGGVEMMAYKAQN